MKNGRDTHLRFHSDLATPKRLPRGWIVLAAGLASWLVVGLLWLGGSQLFSALLAVV